MAPLDPALCPAPLCPACASSLLIEAVEDEPGPEDRVLCRDCGDIGNRRDVIELLIRRAKSAERRMADALTRVLREHGPGHAW